MPGNTQELRLADTQEPVLPKRESEIMPVGTELLTDEEIVVDDPTTDEAVIAETLAPCWAADSKLIFTRSRRPMSISPRTSNSSTGTIIANSSAAAPFSDLLLNLRPSDRIFIARLSVSRCETSALLEAA
jgi:hypothetical protein